MKEVAPGDVEGVRRKVEDAAAIMEPELLALVLDGAPNVCMTYTSTFGLPCRATIFV